MDVMYRDFNGEEKSAAWRQGREHPALRETIPGSQEIQSSAKRSPQCHVVLRKDRHQSGCGTRAWSPTLVTAPLSTCEASPGNLSLDVAVSAQEGGG